MAYRREVIEWAIGLAAQEHETCAAGERTLGDLHCLTDSRVDRAPRFLAPLHNRPHGVRKTPSGDLRIFCEPEWIQEYQEAIEIADKRKRGWWRARTAAIAAYFPRIKGVPAFEDDYAL